MRFFIQMLLTAALGWVATLVLPWWSVTLSSFLVALMLGGKNFRDFMAGFLGMSVLWTMLCLIVLSATGSLLPERMAETISPSLDGTLLGILTGLIGGLLGGFGAMAGGQFRKIFQREK